MIVMASSGVIPGLLDIIIDAIFHITPLVTAVGMEDVVLVSYSPLDVTNGIIGITRFHLSFSYHTGIADLSHQYIV